MSGRRTRLVGLFLLHRGLIVMTAARAVPSLFLGSDHRGFGQLEETGQSIPTDPPAIAKTILDSLALRYASILRTIAALTGQKIKGVQIIGGGSQNDYLNQATANATGLPVLAGPVEATVTGNVLVQAIASGRFASLAEGRQHVAANVRLKRFAPAQTPAWAAAAERYAQIEGRYVN